MINKNSLIVAGDGRGILDRDIAIFPMVRNLIASTVRRTSWASLISACDKSAGCISQRAAVVKGIEIPSRT